MSAARVFGRKIREDIEAMFSGPEYNVGVTTEHTEAVLEAVKYGPRSTEEIVAKVKASCDLGPIEAVAVTTQVLVGNPTHHWAGRRRADGRMEWGQFRGINA